MLQSLHVHNFALIEDAKIDFAPGFNIFTGETVVRFRCAEDRRGR